MPTLPSARAHSAATSPAATALIPGEPYPCTVPPEIPSSAIFGTSSNGNSAFSQYSLTRGVTSFSQKARTRSRISISSGSRSSSRT